MFPDASLSFLPKTTSNHKPLILRTTWCQSFIRKPFKFKAMWTYDPRSYGVVSMLGSMVIMLFLQNIFNFKSNVQRGPAQSGTNANSVNYKLILPLLGLL